MIERDVEDFLYHCMKKSSFPEEQKQYFDDMKQNRAKFFELCQQDWVVKEHIQCAKHGYFMSINDMLISLVLRLAQDRTEYLNKLTEIRLMQCDPVKIFLEE